MQFKSVPVPSTSGSYLFNNTGASQFVQTVDLMREWGWSWAQIDEALGVCYQRSRRVYKSCCSQLRILDKHRYMHCRAY